MGANPVAQFCRKALQFIELLPADKPKRLWRLMAKFRLLLGTPRYASKRC